MIRPKAKMVFRTTLVERRIFTFQRRNCGIRAVVMSMTQANTTDTSITTEPISLGVRGGVKLTPVDLLNRNIKVFG